MWFFSFYFPPLFARGAAPFFPLMWNKSPFFSILGAYFSDFRAGFFFDLFPLSPILLIFFSVNPSRDRGSFSPIVLKKSYPLH